MVLITLLSERIAQPGQKFVYMGPMAECKDCKLKVACLSLEEGRRYRVVKLRPKKHHCKLTGETAVIVEIEEVPLKIAIDKNRAIEGAVISIPNRECRYLNCPNRRLCFPLGVKPKMKHHIDAVAGKINCKEGYNIVKVRVRGPKSQARKEKKE